MCFTWSRPHHLFDTKCYKCIFDYTEIRKKNWVKVFLPCSESTILSFTLYHRWLYFFLYILDSWRHVCDRKKKKTYQCTWHRRRKKNLQKKNFFFRRLVSSVLVNPAVAECLSSRIQNFVDLYIFFLWILTEFFRDFWILQFDWVRSWPCELFKFCCSV
jgi:hypothetical protein